MFGAESGHTDRDVMAAAAAAAGNGFLGIILATVCVLLVGAAGSQLANAFAPFAPQAPHSSRPAGGSSVRHDGSSRHIEGMMHRLLLSEAEQLARQFGSLAPEMQAAVV